MWYNKHKRCYAPLTSIATFFCHNPFPLLFLPLHSLGNILIVYCSSDSIELGNSKQDVSLCNYRSQGMMEEQTEAEVTRNSHFCFSLGGCPLFQTLQLFFVQPASCTIIRPIQSAYPCVRLSSILCGLCLVTILFPHWGHTNKL